MKLQIYLLFILFIPVSLLSQTLKKTQILILGTPHLGQMEDFQSPYLKRVLDSLQAQQFDAIAIENMPAELLLDIQSRKETHWQELFSVYGKRIEFGQTHQNNIGVSFESAKQKINELNQKTKLTEADRVDYINAYICMYDLWSATLHYKQLSDRNKLSKPVIDMLDKLSKSKNEISTIALELAKTSKINQVHYIDNLQDESILIIEFPEFMTDYESNAEAVNKLLNQSDFYNKVTNLEKEAISNKDLYPLYKFYNSKEYMTEDYDAQWALWFKTKFTSKTDRSRYALWEMRNLSITSNILRVVASHPEKKILVVIGASHKSFIEKYLKQIPDIELLGF